MQKAKLRGGALLAQSFKEKGVDHVFTLAGGFCNPALEGFMECQMPVMVGKRTYTTRNIKQARSRPGMTNTI